ncbi:MAG: leucyl aminopeptidase family protein [Burkholderiales bacterium]|nr:leucyl aminopeptidase family protein [Burkholderiales bacterium]
MLPEVVENKSIMTAKQMAIASHVMIVLPLTKTLDTLENVPYLDLLRAALKRKHLQTNELAKAPLTLDLPHGGLCAWVMLDETASRFEQYTILRKAVVALTGEQPKEIALALYGNAKQRELFAELAVYVALLNSAALPSRKKNPAPTPVKKINVYGAQSRDRHARARAVAEGNVLTRELTMLPPNELTPTHYRARVKKLARAHGWQVQEYDFKRLKKIGAGAFTAVAQGSHEQDAAIVHLSYSPKGAKHRIALVGKGICFDTGGHNLKPAKYMHGMHEDMNGSAVALGILLAATRLKLNVGIDAWLAIAQNHISAKAYKQNDVITALNGTTIEIMHTDAEGRMVLADTLTLASRAKPAAIIDFATLTGSMAVALGARYSGIFSNREEWAAAAIAAGRTSSERVNAFPLDADYEPALDSKIADIKQCTLDGEADHILAARFLMRFLEKDIPWVHMDLSASTCEGGLGAVASNVTGFGVAWGVEMLKKL